MRRTLISVLTVALLAVTALGVGLTVQQVDAAKDNAGARSSAHAGDDHHALGMERPTFPAATGSIPSAEDANHLEELHHVRIFSDEDFNPSNGVRGGAGTLEDPYVISGYYVPGDLYIGDTDACVVVRENYVGGQLSLNWNGQCVHVHHNYVNDLRVNENIKRTGYATGGLLEQNEISFVGQLRHYDGEFRDNVVGPFTPNNIFDTILETVPVPWVENYRVANIDGFNQGLIHHNTFIGSVDLDLHGHHHGTGFFAPHSHYHGSMDGKGMEHDHTDRWTSVTFAHNKIIDTQGYGLRYEDRNHAGDDRTANSEDEMTLREPHQHHTKVTIEGNTLEGAGIWIDVFNANDELHRERNPGWLDLVDNTITFEERENNDLVFLRFDYMPNAGIYIDSVKELEGRVEGNAIEFIPLPEQELDPSSIWAQPWMQEELPTAIRLRGVTDAAWSIQGNSATGFTYGVAAYHMDDMTTWLVLDNDFGDAQYDVWYDSTVSNEPETEPGQGAGSEEPKEPKHEHG